MNTTSNSNNEYNNLIELIVNSVSSKLMKAIEPRLLNIEHKLDQLVEHSTISIAQKNSKNKKKKKKNIVSDIEKKKIKDEVIEVIETSLTGKEEKVSFNSTPQSVRGKKTKNYLVELAMKVPPNFDKGVVEAVVDDQVVCL